jgi:hypothetical protein
MNERIAAFRIGDGEAASSRSRGPRPAGHAKITPAAATRPQWPTAKAADAAKPKPVAAPKRAANGGNGVGAVPRMQAAVAAALASDPQWRNFERRRFLITH